VTINGDVSANTNVECNDIYNISGSLGYHVKVNGKDISLKSPKNNNSIIQSIFLSASASTNDDEKQIHPHSAPGGPTIESTSDKEIKQVVKSTSNIHNESEGDSYLNISHTFFGSSLNVTNIANNNAIMNFSGNVVHGDVKLTNIFKSSS